MGEPAVPTPEERRFRRELARDVVAAVRDDREGPLDAPDALDAALTSSEWTDDGMLAERAELRTWAERIDLAAFGIAHELTMTRDEVEKVAREMIAEGRLEHHGSSSTFGRRLLFVLGIAP